MSLMNEITTPPGRLVMGDLYEGQTTDMHGNPLTDKKGNPRTEYFFAQAIPKGSESHWKETPWGKLIWEVGERNWQSGQLNHRDFSWKILDGDSEEQDSKGNCLKNRDGCAGCWVLKFNSGFASKIFNEDGTKPLLEKDHVKPGSYIQVFGTVKSNNQPKNPGIYLNHVYVAFSAFGDPIAFDGKDAKAVGFGGAPLPPGASKTPASSFSPAPAPTAAPAAVTPPPAPEPHTGILNPPARQMTDKAQASYEDYIKAGWTDQQLIDSGMMVA